MYVRKRTCSAGGLNMRLAVIVFSLLFSFAFAENKAVSAVSLESCDSDQIISQSVDAKKAELEFTSNKSIAKCFFSLNAQMNANGWERARNTNNIYQGNLYRIIYAQEDGAKQMLIVRKVDNVYKVILDL